MEYIIIIILQLLGIGFHVGQKVLELDKLSPDDSLGDVFKLFWKTDKITILISGLILIMFVIGHYVVHNYTPKTIASYEYLDLITFVAALVFGYGGQGIIYRALGKSIDFANKKIDEKLS